MIATELIDTVVEEMVKDGEEGLKASQAFTVYYKLGRGRTLNKVKSNLYDEYIEGKRKEVPSMHDLSIWHRMYRWDAIISDIEIKSSQIAFADEIQRKADIKAQRLKMASKLRSAADLIIDEVMDAVDQLALISDPEKKLKLLPIAIQASEAASREERLEFGESTSNSKIMVEKFISRLPIPEKEKLEIRESLMADINSLESK